MKHRNDSEYYSEADSTRSNDQLGSRLRREAMGSAPKFSEARHERLWRAIREAPPLGDLEIDAGGPARNAGRRRVAWLSGAAIGSAVAAACAVIVVAWSLRRAEPVDDPLPAPPASVASHQPAAASGPARAPFIAEVPVVPGVFSVGPNVEPLLEDVDERLTSTQWAYLDHDAKVVLAWAADALPRPPGWNEAAER